MYQTTKKLPEFAKIIDETRRLLGWPTTQKLVRLVNKYPGDELWQYALVKLREADHPNEKYLLACLETAAKGEVPTPHRGRKVSMTSPMLFCYHCGYAVEYCRRTAGWDRCPLCLRKGTESRLTYIDRSEPDWSRG